jgi:hypothetical protein
VLIPLVLSALFTRAARDDIRSRRATYGPMKFTFTEDGISGGADAEGFTFAHGWAQYRGFYVGRSVIVCPRIASLVYLRIPTEGLPTSQKEEILSILSRHLSELSRDALRQ